MPPLQVLTAKTTLTNAEVLDLPITPAVLIPAPGTGRIIYPFGIYLHLNWVADYADIGDDALIRFRLGLIEVLLPLRQDIGTQVSRLLAGGGSTNSFVRRYFSRKLRLISLPALPVTELTAPAYLTRTLSINH